jgi:hypothetical protein
MTSLKRNNKVPEESIVEASNPLNARSVDTTSSEDPQPQQLVLDNLFTKLDQLTRLLTDEQPGETIEGPQFREKLKMGLLNIFLDSELEEISQDQENERVKLTQDLFTNVRKTLEARSGNKEENARIIEATRSRRVLEAEKQPALEYTLSDTAEPEISAGQNFPQDKEAVIDKLVSILLDNQELLGTAKGNALEGRTKTFLPPAVQTNEILQVLSAAFYQATREALALNTFKSTDDSPWPTARLSKGGATGHAQLVPPVIENEPLLPPKETERWVQVMWKQREELSDLDADALDLLCHFWLEQAKRPEDAAIAL